MAIELVTFSADHQHLKETALDATTTTASSSFDMSAFPNGNYQVVWAGIAAGSATYELQSSLDGGTSWDTITGSSASTSGASGSASEAFSGSLPGGLIRLKITATTGSAGTLAFYIIGKK